MLGRLRKIARLNPADRTLLLRALLIVTAVRVGLWSLPFHLLQELAARASQCAASRHRKNTQSIAALAAAVEIAARPIPAATCLTQALAAQFLLAHDSHASTLRIGVLTADGRFKAHAWLEHAGRIVIGDVAGIGEFKALPLRAR